VVTSSRTPDQTDQPSTLPERHLSRSNHRGSSIRNGITRIFGVVAVAGVLTIASAGLAAAATPGHMDPPLPPRHHPIIPIGGIIHPDCWLCTE
jgi:hypothetical protein